MSEPIWTLEQGVEACRKLEAELAKIHYHCALGGSVLMKGSSVKDIDIFIYPHKTENALPTSRVVKFLSDLFKTELFRADHERQSESQQGDPDGKIVYYMQPDAKRVDFFFVS